VLAHDWVVLLQLQTLARIHLVLAGDVHIAGVCRATKLDDWTLVFTFCSHDSFSDFLTSCTDVGNYAFDATLVDGAKTLCTDVQGDPALL
jgi:hypothetical protein